MCLKPVIKSVAGFLWNPSQRTKDAWERNKEIALEVDKSTIKIASEFKKKIKRKKSVYLFFFIILGFII